MFKALRYNKLLNNIGEVSTIGNFVSINVDNKVLEKMLSITDNVLLIKSTHFKNKYNNSINYKIKDMTFDGVTICVDEGVSFENCTFINGANIIKADTLIFNNNKYISTKDEYDDNFFKGKNIESIIFYEENISDQNVAFRIDADRIQLFNANLLKDNGHVNLKCDRLSMNNSTIGGETSFVDAKKMFLMDNSSIKNTKNCMIQCKDINGGNTFIAPRTIINGKLYEMTKNKIKDYS